jgi:hypothetical protein
MRNSCDGLIGFVDAYSLEDRRSGTTTLEFTLTTGGPGVWLRVTPRLPCTADGLAETLDGRVK